MKKTVVLGASPDSSRYAHRATKKLLSNGYEVVPIGIIEGEIEGVEIQTDFPLVEDVHTLTLYLNPGNQKKVYPYILDLNPKRIIFNPGTENHELESMARKRGIETIHDCTLVMLAVNSY